VRTRRSQEGEDDPIVLPRDDDITIVVDEAELPSDRAAQYRDWAERLRMKRAVAQDRIRGSAPRESPTYWRTEDVYRESKRLADGEVPHRADPIVQDLLAVFGITGEPSPRQVENEFRRLAKEHHPDRHVGEDEATRTYHLEQMRRVNEAYARLRQLQLA
jgi:DnaJ-domain-containing protein 1